MSQKENEGSEVTPVADVRPEGELLPILPPPLEPVVEVASHMVEASTPVVKAEIAPEVISAIFTDSPVVPSASPAEDEESTNSDNNDLLPHLVDNKRILLSEISGGLKYIEEHQDISNTDLLRDCVVPILQSIREFLSIDTIHSSVSSNLLQQLYANDGGIAELKEYEEIKDLLDKAALAFKESVDPTVFNNTPEDGDLTIKKKAMVDIVNLLTKLALIVNS